MNLRQHFSHWTNGEVTLATLLHDLTQLAVDFEADLTSNDHPALKRSINDLAKKSQELSEYVNELVAKAANLARTQNPGEFIDYTQKHKRKSES